MAATLLGLLLCACGGSGSSGAGDERITDPVDTVEDGSERRALALDGLHAHDALYFVAGPLIEEVRLLLDEPDQACPITGSVQIDSEEEAVRYQFDDCALRVEPAVSVSGGLVLGGTDLQDRATRAELAFTDLVLRRGTLSVRITGVLGQQSDAALILLDGAADITLSADDGTLRTVSISDLRLLLDQSRLSVVRELDYQAIIVDDDRSNSFVASGSVEGGSAGCPLSGRWRFDPNENDPVSVAGGEGGNLLLVDGNTSSTLACSELQLLDASQAIAPPRPPGS